MSKSIDQDSNNQNDDKSAPSYQSIRYLQGCSSIVMAWHKRLVDIKNNANDAPVNDEADNGYSAFFRTSISSSDAAKLKRCQHIDEVAMQPTFIALWQQVNNKLNASANKTVITDATFNAWLAVAWVLAQVRHADERYYVSGNDKAKHRLINNMAHVAGSQDNERPLITPLRFEKLISARNPNDFVQLLSRMVAQLQQQGKPLNIVLLANDIMHRFADFQGSNYRSPKDKLTVQWSLSYYQMNAA